MDPTVSEGVEYAVRSVENTRLDILLHLKAEESRALGY